MNVNDLKKEDNFIKYMISLKQISERYTIVIDSYDTPFGPGYDREFSLLFRNLGLKTDLYGAYRAGYVAVIDSGKVIFEELSTGKAVTFDKKVNDTSIKAISTGYDSNDWVSCLTINGNNCFAKSRGINFAVFDSFTGYLIDYVGFDTYSEGCPCTRPTDTIEFIKRIKKDKGVTVVVCKFPAFPTVDITLKEKEILSGVGANNLLDYYDTKGIALVTYVPQSYYDVHGIRRFIDFKSELLNTSGGHRVTGFQPKTVEKSIFMVGGCRMYGFGADDNNTVESHLQRIFNSELPDAKIIVQNYGFMFTGMKKNETLSIIDALPTKPGDIVLTELNIGDYNDPDIKVIDISDAFCCPRDFNAFFDTVHYTPDGNRFTAEVLFKNIQSAGLLNSETREKSDLYLGMNDSDSEYLEAYKNILRDYYSERFQKPVIGSIVMNCNPFTVGHRYLIEKALDQCDFLMIFVVEEDKSCFPFEDRFKLVEQCTSDIVNKEIIPSGKFIISSLTFSEYFNKSELQEKKIDTSLDVVLFAREIAPCLNITKRFAGEEPDDTVTRQYNETMARILPEYGIEFIEIPRASVNGSAVSASKVRELIEKKEYDAIRELVPEETYQYIMEHFN